MPDKILPVIHPNTPRKLAQLFEQLQGRYHQVAANRRVNVYHVYQLITKGTEPKNPDIRMRLFLPRRPRRKKRDSQPRTPTQRAIDTMAKETRNAIKAAFKPKTSSTRARN